jgi:glycosyltransferase involved in cell wall biosynthesis
MKQKPFFSIVIPTLNEEVYLPQLLDDLKSQTNHDFEVIHVDGNSEDNTLNEAKKFAKVFSFPMVFLNTKKRNVSYQRNLGGKKAQGEWVIFMDADNRVPPQYLDGIKYRLAEKPQTDVFTTWVEINNDSAINKPIERAINFSLELGQLIGKEWSFGALIGVSKQVLNEGYKFDEQQKVFEDGLFIKSLIENNFTFNIFKNPKYFYSIRRLQSEGTLNVARKSALLTLNYFQGKDFSEKDFGYKMDGGSSYSSKYKIDSSSWKNFDLLGLKSLQKFAKTTSEKQLEQAKKLINKLKKFEF